AEPQREILVADHSQVRADMRGPAIHQRRDHRRRGRGVAADLNQAELWYAKAAAQGHEQAEASYGLALFTNGKRDKAAPWLQRAAGRGDPRAQYVLGTMYFNGDVVQKDWVR
ncbi:sel1 repeat family protein, partial [Escherichia coli]|nr:sel1 repeat family protein [Escherichia coli]